MSRWCRCFWVWLQSFYTLEFKKNMKIKFWNVFQNMLSNIGIWMIETGQYMAISSVQLLSRVLLFATLWTADARLPCPAPTPGAYPNSCPLSWWCHPAISSSVILFSSCPQSFPASGSFQKSQLFATGGQSIGVSASTSVLPMNIKERSPLGWTDWIPLQSKGRARVFSNTTVQKHQFFGTQLSLYSKSHIRTWLLEKP